MIGDTAADGAEFLHGKPGAVAHAIAEDIAVALLIVFRARVREV